MKLTVAPSLSLYNISLLPLATIPLSKGMNNAHIVFTFYDYRVRIKVKGRY